MTNPPFRAFYTLPRPLALLILLLFTLRPAAQWASVGGMPAPKRQGDALVFHNAQGTAAPSRRSRTTSSASASLRRGWVVDPGGWIVVKQPDRLEGVRVVVSTLLSMRK